VRIPLGQGIHKRPDIVLFQGDKPVLVIECKIGAGFTGLEEEAESGLIRWVGQLEHYDRWLSTHGSTDAALVLLTHLSEPPQDFQSGDGFSIRTRAVRKWANLYCFLADSERRSWWNRGRSGLDAIVADFLELLEEYELMSEDPSLNDFAAARLLTTRGAYGRVLSCLRHASNRIRPILKDRGCSSFPKGYAYIWSDGDDGFITDQADTQSGVQLVWGLWFGMPGSKFFGDGLEPPLRQHEGIVFYITLSKSLEQSTPSQFPGWHFPAGGSTDGTFVVKPRPLSEFFEDSDATTAMALWLEKAANEALQIVT
jgi:hypothetical protein